MSPLELDERVDPIGPDAATTGRRASNKGFLPISLRDYLQLFNSTPLAAVLPSLVGERAHNPELSELLDPVLKGRRQPLTRALQRGVERGELSPDLDLQLAADLIVGPIAVKLFFSGAKVSPRMVDPVVELALAGIRGIGRGDG